MKQSWQTERRNRQFKRVVGDIVPHFQYCLGQAEGAWGYRSIEQHYKLTKPNKNM